MYCLDTNIVIYYQKNIKNVSKFILTKTDSQLCITHITRAELIYGAYNSNKVKENLLIQEKFCSKIEVINSNVDSDNLYGKIKSYLRKIGAPIDDCDILIASICLANNYILVTHNIKDFKNIPHLKLENWAE